MRGLSDRESVGFNLQAYRIARRRSSGDLADLRLDELAALLPPISETGESHPFTGGNSRVGYDPEFKLQTGRLVHRRRSAGEIYTIAKMSNIPPHLCKKRHKVLPSRLASLIGKHNKQSEPKEMFAFEKGKKTKKQTSLVEDKLSAYRESRMIISDDELDEPEVICCPKCKEIFSINRPPAKPTSALKIPCLKEMDAQQKSATRYWQSYLRSTSNSWINFNTDNVYCY